MMEHINTSDIDSGEEDDDDTFSNINIENSNINNKESDEFDSQTNDTNQSSQISGDNTVNTPLCNKNIDKIESIQIPKENSITFKSYTVERGNSICSETPIPNQCNKQKQRKNNAIQLVEKDE